MRRMRLKRKKQPSVFTAEISKDKILTKKDDLIKKMWLSLTAIATMVSEDKFSLELLAESALDITSCLDYDIVYKAYNTRGKKK